MRLRPYEAGDERRFTPRPDFAADLADAGGALHDGPRYTLIADDGVTVLGLGGLTPLEREFSYGAWAYLGNLTPRQWVQAARLAAEVCGMATTCAGWRIYAVPADTDAAQRLLASMGFRPSPDDDGVWKLMRKGL
ncbi:hypothetical protein [Phenylobacterium sp. SCN 70-31]|uniref:hypothetical protein n=1 Tax=Phenylobacterium sp. SCN 70-31 TaxID=1660129 RepID=UPI00086EEA72|nr:hypothetical protein [Phenylobacterium sp. SCN 70-31]ODT88107.1 MAG: hypothetical protein ABS78_09450 [Phenylobacterium sp. SCN 70-31]